MITIFLNVTHFWQKINHIEDISNGYIDDEKLLKLNRSLIVLRKEWSRNKKALSQVKTFVSMPTTDLLQPSINVAFPIKPIVAQQQDLIPLAKISANHPSTSYRNDSESRDLVGKKVVLFTMDSIDSYERNSRAGGAAGVQIIFSS